jgi:hypothetical protein
MASLHLLSPAAFFEALSGTEPIVFALGIGGNAPKCLAQFC